jgi:hypothetical protein
MELSEHFVDFEKRSSIKSQVIADFIAEWTEPSSYTEGPVPESSWMIYCDRAWGNVRTKVVPFLFHRQKSSSDTQRGCNSPRKLINVPITSPNKKLYFCGLRKLRAIIVQRCTIKSDLNVVTSQIEKECTTR